ncbi:FAD-dependent oxidoreductase [Actinosynnema sp. NPDC020468]|uniref:FAD-dependent oxidoreductase n=1 Tax=Actinosynnema sp. NPDC020468 TaxID=3154488 RepID=UPI0033D563F0
MKVVVVGGGPAGMAAADAAVAAGADTTVVDGEPVLGGQFHRGDPRRVDPRVRHVADATVWAVEGTRLHVRVGPDGAGRRGLVLDADAVVLATGAHDRVVPFPGWDLPGVYTAGAAQALAKGQGVAVGKRVVVSGTGPFLLPVARSLIGVGARVLAVCEANHLTGWLRHPVVDPGKLAELAGYAAVLARHRVPWRPRTAVVAAHGEDRVTAVTLARLSPEWTVVASRRVEVDAVCVTHGFTPRLELAVAAGCALDGGVVRVDDRGATSVPGYYAAGEITGVGGARLAAAEGALAGAAAAGARWVTGELKPGRRFGAALAAVGSSVRAGASRASADEGLSVGGVSGGLGSAAWSDGRSSSGAATGRRAPADGGSSVGGVSGGLGSAAWSDGRSPSGEATGEAAGRRAVAPAEDRLPAGEVAAGRTFAGAWAESRSSARELRSGRRFAGAWAGLRACARELKPGLKVGVAWAGLRWSVRELRSGRKVGVVLAAARSSARAVPRGQGFAGAEALLREVRRGRRFAAALAAVHPVRPGWRTWLTAETLVCRCEEVPRCRLDDLGPVGVRTLKLRTRVGLGWCQGRMCLVNAVELADVRPDEAAVHRRPVAGPVRLGELADNPEENP